MRDSSTSASLEAYISSRECMSWLRELCCGDGAGLSNASPSRTVCTGRYPTLGCFLKYLFDLNLFLSALVKSRTSSPDVVCRRSKRVSLLPVADAETFYGAEARYGEEELTAVQYSCIGCVNLWFFALRPEKKQFWHMSKLKHFKHRYLK